MIGMYLLWGYCVVLLCFFGCSFLPLLVSSLVIWWLSLVLCLDSFVCFFFICVCIINFWLVFTMRFTYGNLYVIILSCWFIKFKCIFKNPANYCSLLCLLFWHHILCLFVFCVLLLLSMDIDDFTTFIF